MTWAGRPTFGMVRFLGYKGVIFWDQEILALCLKTNFDKITTLPSPLSQIPFASTYLHQIRYTSHTCKQDHIKAGLFSGRRSVQISWFQKITPLLWTSSQVTSKIFKSARIIIFVIQRHDLKFAILLHSHFFLGQWSEAKLVLTVCVFYNSFPYP